MNFDRAPVVEFAAAPALVGADAWCDGEPSGARRHLGEEMSVVERCESHLHYWSLPTEAGDACLCGDRRWWTEAYSGHPEEVELHQRRSWKEWMMDSRANKAEAALLRAFGYRWTEIGSFQGITGSAARTRVVSGGADYVTTVLSAMKDGLR